MLSAINSIINQYILIVSTNYNIPVGELQALMDRMPSSPNTSIQPLTPVQNLQPVVIQTPKPADDPDSLCSFIYLRGQKKGTRCTRKRKRDADVCSQHAKKEKSDTPATIEVKPAKEASKKPSIILRINKIINKYWHPETGMVFKSKDEKVVIGIYKDNALRDLSEEDIPVCIEHRFQYIFNNRKLAMKNDDEEDDEKEVSEPQPKKAKMIDESFIQINKQARNVEGIIRDMFDYGDGGACESKNCDEEEEEDEVVEEEEEELLEEED